MDPEVVLIELLTALFREDGELASIKARDLAEWIDKGGHCPDNAMDALQGIIVARRKAVSEGRA